MPKRFIGEPFCAVFQKYSGGEKIDGLERRGIKTFRRKNFVSECRKNSYGNLSVLCFRKLAVAKKLMDKRGGGVSRFSVESFWSHSDEKFRRGPLGCFTNFGYKKVLGMNRRNIWHGSIKTCRQNFFCLTMPKSFIGRPFCAVFQKISGSENIYGYKRRGTKTFRRNVFVSHCGIVS